MNRFYFYANDTTCLQFFMEPHVQTAIRGKLLIFMMRCWAKKNIPHHFFTLEGVDESIFNKTFHNPKHPQLASIEDGILAPTEKYIFIVPEYNGSFPGMLKGFLDACDIKKCFHNKKVCLTGVAEGRAGNLRGMEHLTNIFNHIKMDVLHLKIPISQVHLMLDEAGKLQKS
jgi:NAD(P)H-dependent FMN reductase